MKPFRTEIIPQPFEQKLKHHQSMMHIGSCFSEHIGNKFKSAGVPTLINPFGQQYNLLSIAGALSRIMNKELYTKEELIAHDEMVHSLHHHGDFSGADAEATVSNINKKLTEAHLFLKQTDWLFITPGTSHIFEWKETGKVVSNCHKIPASQFNSRMVEGDETITIWTPLLHQIYSFNPEIKIVFTVSPVRYFAFGAHENTLSKSMLFAAIHGLKNIYPHIYYFPSYELVVDDLRDYRFYNADMIHPNAQAIDYVWEKLKIALCSEDCLKLMDVIEKIKLGCNHRPRNILSQNHQQFIKKLLTQIADLEGHYDHLNLAEERALLQAVLA